MQFALISWNCNGLLNHWEDFKILLHHYNPTVVALQKTHLNPQNTLTISGYTVYSKALDDHFAHGPNSGKI